MRISIQHDLKKLKRRINVIHRRQIPFATSQALNDIAFKIRNDTVRVLWPRSVNVKQRNFARAAFRVGKASKRNLTATVFDQLDRAFLPRQITGGIKMPYSSTHIAIPTHNAMTRTGRIKRSAQLSNPNLFRLRTRRGEGLWLRDRRGKRKITLMYVLKPRASVPKAFPFYEFGERTARLHFNRFWDRRVRRAIKTAR